MGAVSLFGGLVVGGNWCQHEMGGGGGRGLHREERKREAMVGEIRAKVGKVRVRR